VKLTVAWIGRTKNSAIQSLTDEYLRRIRQYAEAEAIALKDEAALFDAAGERGRGRRRFLVVADSRGKQLSSEEMAEFIAGHQERSPQPLCFAVGGPDGFSAGARNRADFILSLGKMTFAHELARVILVEQLYRAFTILKGHPYHVGH